MAGIFKMKVGDRKVALKYQLGNYAEGSNILDGASVAFQMMDPNGNTVIDAAGVILDDDGIVGYEWADGDTDTANQYYGEFKIIYSDSLVQHDPPGEDFIRVLIGAGVADA